MLCLGVTWEGMACGPTAMTAYFGIDFAPGMSEEGEAGAGCDGEDNEDQR